MVASSEVTGVTASGAAEAPGALSGSAQLGQSEERDRAAAKPELRVAGKPVDERAEGAAARSGVDHGRGSAGDPRRQAEKRRELRKAGVGGAELRLEGRIRPVAGIDDRQIAGEDCRH